LLKNEIKSSGKAHLLRFPHKRVICALLWNQKRVFRREIALLAAWVLMSTLPQNTLAQAADDNEKIGFKIPQQRADQALIEFAEQADVTFIFPVDEAKHITANPVSGTYTRGEAVRILLSGTGLQPKFSSSGDLTVNSESSNTTEWNEEGPMTDTKQSFAKKFSALVALTLGAAGVLGTTDGLAQSPTDEAKPVLEEVIVTAQRRAETLQTVPMAITVFSGDELRQQGILDLKSLSERTPGLFISDPSPGQAEFFMRGVGSSDDGAAADRSVPLYIDEVYIPRTSSQVVDLLDLERVEVLRGPQGTLFGRNAAGGAIHLITQKPTETPEARVEATYGNLNAVNLQAFVSGPIVGDILGKVSVSSRSRDGYITSVMGDFPDIASTENPANLQDLDFMNINSDTIRGGLRYLAGENLEINASASYSARDETGVIRYYVPGPADGGFFYSSDSLLVPNYENNIRKTVHDDPGNAKIRNWLGSFRIDYGLSWGATLTSLTSYQKTEFSSDETLATENMAKLRLSTSGPPFTFLGDNPVNEDSDAFSQELRLSSSTDGPLQWVAGLYYLEESVDRHETAGLGVVVSDGAGGLIEIIPVTRGGEIQEAQSESYAAFAQGTYLITDSLRLTAGVRYTKDDKEVHLVGTAGGLVVAEDYAGTSSESWSKTTPKVSLDFMVNEDIMLYALASNGFKSGGWQGLAPTAASALTPFEPETTWLFEVGAKSEWFEDRLRINVALFEQDYEDMQIAQSLIPEDAPPEVVAVLFTNNAASSKIKGVEAEIEAAPTPNWFFSGTYSYLDTSFTEFLVPEGFRLGVGAPPVEDRVGNDLPRAPRNMANALARYTLDLRGGGNVTMQASYRYIGKSYGDVDNLYFGVVPEYSLVDARVTYYTPGDNWSISLWGNNLTEEDYFLTAFPNVGSGWATPGPPRTYGVTVSWRM
jgi:iron complex outermembrane receptor protein